LQVLALHLQCFEIALFVNPKSEIPARQAAGGQNPKSCLNWLFVQALNSLRRSIHSWDAKVLYISEEISSKAMFYIEQHFLSHSLQLADALIGATALTYGLPILTGNDKHYRTVKDIQIKKFRP